MRIAAAHYFADRLPLAERYADMLATDGVVRGLIGPREVPRIWERHLLNSVALVELLPPEVTAPSEAAASSEATVPSEVAAPSEAAASSDVAAPSEVAVIDVGSGAGLPGLAMAIARPDLKVLLVEPQLRRTTFLEEVVRELGLGQVTVLRARAEEAVRRTEPADVVVARAVAPLDRLATWCLPLAKIGGRLLALKGASASTEVVAHHDAVRRAGGGSPAVVRCGSEFLEPPATVITVVRERQTTARANGAGRSRRGAGRQT